MFFVSKLSCPLACNTIRSELIWRFKTDSTALHSAWQNVSNSSKLTSNLPPRILLNLLFNGYDPVSRQSLGPSICFANICGNVDLPTPLARVFKTNAQSFLLPLHKLAIHFSNVKIHHRAYYIKHQTYNFKKFDIYL